MEKDTKNRIAGFLLAGLLSLGFLPATVIAQSASFRFSPEQGTYQVSQNFKVAVIVDSASDAINAAQVNVSFNPQLLKVVNITKGNLFSYWPIEPGFDNTAGNVTAAGGTPKSYQGSGTAIITLTFKALQAGSVEVGESNGKILLADGTGKNIYTPGSPAEFAIAAPQIPLVPPALGASAAGVSSPTQPDPSLWYSNSTATLRWTLPAGTDGVAFMTDHNPDTTPADASQGLQTTHTYHNVADGIWYFHIKYHSKNGWSAPAHFRFQIDTIAPIWNSITEASSSDPSLQAFLFDVTDTGSGIDHYEVSLDGGAARSWISQPGQDYTMPAAPAGSHVLTATVYDRAGNHAALDYHFISVGSVVCPPPTGFVPVLQSRNSKLNFSPAADLALVILLLIIILLLILLWRVRRDLSDIKNKDPLQK